MSAEHIRDEVRSWLAEHWSDDITVREWWRRLADAGWSAPTWPEPYGRGLSSAEARVVTGELAAVGAIGPPEGTVAMVLAGPTLLEKGTEEQCARLLPPLLRGEEAWCQLFSEPGAGSDLASLGARAVRDGDEWVVNGQKVWNSGADVARRGMLLARTDVDVRKQDGITYFVIDMDQPGVEARPLRQLNGEATFCEVFLTDARVAAADVVGEVHGGWRVARTTLGHERVAVGSRSAPGLVFVSSGEKAGNLDRQVGEVCTAPVEARPYTGMAVPVRKLVELAKERGLDRDPTIRQRLAAYYIATQVNRFTQQRARASAVRGQAPGPEGSIIKLATSWICHESRDLTFAILGADAMLAGPDAPFDGALHTVSLSSFAVSIGGGTDEVQRNLVAERSLGLPREPQADADVPYRDLQVGTQRRT